MQHLYYLHKAMTKKLSVAYNSIFEIKPYKQGASKAGNVDKVIKLSSNENPFGTSPYAIEAIKKSASNIGRYPDGSCTELRNSISARYNLNANNIICGAGSDEIIALLCQAYAGKGDEIIYTSHGFLMYPISAARVGAIPVVAEEKNLRTDIESIIAKVTDRTKIIFIANPNNPTGSYITKDEMRQLRNSLPDNVLLVIDAAYAEYVEAEDYSSGFELAEEYDNVVVTRTFSKIYGLGGLRIGWSYSQNGIADVLNRVRGPFNVSSIAQAAAIAAINDIEFEDKSRQHNNKWRKIVSDKLSDIGLIAYPSVANFVLVKFANNETANKANEYLKSNGIIGRAMVEYSLPEYMRFTIGLEEENKALITVLSDFSLASTGLVN